MLSCVNFVSWGLPVDVGDVMVTSFGNWGMDSVAHIYNDFELY